MGHSEEMIQKAIAQENGKVHVRLFFSWKRNHKGSKCLSSVWLQPGQKVQRALPDARNRRRRSRVGNG